MLVVAGLVIVMAMVVAMTDGDAKAAEPSALPAAKPTKSLSSLRPFSSPLLGVGDEGWTRYVRLMATGRLATVSPGGHLGVFGLGLKRLQDLGLVAASRKVERDGRLVWEASWVPPFSLQRFLSDGSMQYNAFVKHSVNHAARIQERHAEAIGQTFATKVATLSGLLAVAHQAGLKGLAQWLQDEGDRQRFPHTTAAFIKATGIF